MVQHSTVLVPVLWIRIGFNADPDPGFDDLKLGKIEVLTKTDIYFLFLKNCNILFGQFLPTRFRIRILPTKNQCGSMRIRIHGIVVP